MLFPQRLDELMHKHGFKQQSLADRVGVVQQTVSKWLKGKALPDLDTLIVLSNVFNVSVDYMLGLIDYPVYYFDTKKDPSLIDQEQAIAIASAARAGLPVNGPMPTDMSELILLIQRIVDLEFDKRSTPNDDPSGSRCQTCPSSSLMERQ